MLIFLKGLTRATRLVKLHLRSQCSDAVLATVAASCLLLRQIDISRSEQVSVCFHLFHLFRTGGNLFQRMASAGHWSGHRLWAETPPLLLISCVRQRSQVLGSHPCWRGRFNQFDISTTLQLSYSSPLTIHRTPAGSSTYSLALLCEHDGSDGGNLKRREGACRSFFSRAL